MSPELIKEFKAGCVHYNPEQLCACRNNCEYVKAIQHESDTDSKLEVRHYSVGRPYWMAGILAIATGLEPEEVLMRLGGKLPNGGFYSGQIASMLRDLGYDCSPDFKTKFDRNTDKICLMRYTMSARYWVEERAALREKTKNPKAQLGKKYHTWWSIFVYYNGLIYNPSCSEPFPLDADFVKQNYKPTRMMQVWLSDL